MTSKTTEDRDPAVETAAWVEEHGDFLFHFALRRLQNEDAAEEVLQQTLFAAFKARDQYKGDGVFRVWLTGILKRKIIDYFRARGRAFTSQLEEGPDITEQLFDKKGKWKSDPRIFGNSPGASIESEEFWLVFNGWLEKLPGKQGSVFSSERLMRNRLTTSARPCRFRLPTCGSCCTGPGSPWHGA
ncbi:MAG: sigma-70 family RNA polymerase sigma factor [Planctomycetota bacterium]|nr:sigma-70 family RNA polymerase sigma factor [Planctomycetota bacterium]